MNVHCTLSIQYAPSCTIYMCVHCAQYLLYIVSQTRYIFRDKAKQCNFEEVSSKYVITTRPNLTDSKIDYDSKLIILRASFVLDTDLDIIAIL